MLNIKDWSLKRKIILHVIVIGAVAAFILTFLYINTQRNIIHTMNKERAELVGSMIENSISPAMEKGKSDKCQSILQDIASSKGLKKIRIMSPEGQIIQSSDREEMGSFAGREILIKIDELLQKNDASSTFFIRPDSTLQEFQVIENRKECMECHSPDEKINGILEVNIDYSNTIGFLRKSQLKGVVIALASLAILVVIILRLFEKLINRPISSLKDMMAKVEKGNLHLQLHVKKHDEIGNLTQSFNQMVRNLEEANTKIEELFSKQMEKAEHLASIGELAAGLAHEIKNPIAGMKGALEIINQKTDSSNPNKEIFTEMLLQIDKINKVIHDLLSYAKPKEMNKRVVDPNEAVNNAIKLARTQISDKEIDIQFKSLTNRTRALIDADKIQEVILNLMVNSISAINNKGRISIELHKKNQKELEIFFSDDGMGIKQEHMSQIFNPFFTTKNRGTGLGLSICKKIIEAHNGSIEVKSKSKEGTTFSIRLPVLNPED